MRPVLARVGVSADTAARLAHLGVTRRTEADRATAKARKKLARASSAKAWTRKVAEVLAPVDTRPSVIMTSVDWFQLHMRVDFDLAVLAALRKALELATKIGRAAFRYGSLEGEVKRTSGARSLLLTCRSFRVKIELPEEDPEWAREIEPRIVETPWNVNLTWEREGRELAGLTGLGAWSGLVGASLGTVVEYRLLRVDLAVDIANWAFEPEETARLMRKGPAKSADYYGVPGCEYNGRSTRLGWTVSPGNAIEVRCYAKSEQVRKLPYDDLLHIAKLWQAHGWNPCDPVRRVEVQCRGEFLEEISARDPMALIELADRIWAYVVKEWLRMIVPGTNARASRCDLDPRWAALADVRFKDWAAAAVIEPVRRERRRAGARAEQTLGCVLSTLGAVDKLPRMLFEETRAALFQGGAAEDEAADGAVRFVHRLVGHLFATAATEVADRLLESRHARGVADRLMLLVDARNARFALWKGAERERYVLPPDLAALGEEHLRIFRERLAA